MTNDNPFTIQYRDRIYTCPVCRGMFQSAEGYEGRSGKFYCGVNCARDARDTAEALAAQKEKMECP